MKLNPEGSCLLLDSNERMALLPELDYFPSFIWKICNKSIALLCLDEVLAFHTGNNRLSHLPATQLADALNLHFPYGQVCRGESTTYSLSLDWDASDASASALLSVCTDS